MTEKPHEYRELNPTERAVIDAALDDDPAALAAAVAHLRRVGEYAERAAQVMGDRRDGTQVLVGGRMSGKTMKAAEWVKAGRCRSVLDGAVSNDRRLVVLEERTVRHLMRAHDLQRDEMVTLHWLRQPGRTVNPADLAIDESLDIIIRALQLRGVPGLVTIASGE